MHFKHCIFYAAGLFVAFAYDDVSYNKSATQSDTTIGTGNDARSAIDGNIATCTKTKDIGGNSPHKTTWWKVDLGGMYRIYRVNIIFKSYDGFVERQRGRFAGFSLYVSNTDVSSDADIKGSALCYNDGPQLPPLNFTAICTKNGRYVIYYNERLEGVVYPSGYEVDNVFTELCTVIIQGCKNASFYGSKCDTPCPNNCEDRTCHIQSGECFNCKSGWTGINCNTTCGEGRYGENCSNHCSGHCRDGATCNHVTGQCDRGCAAGWTGTFCYEECVNGTYGYNCVNNCSGHCMNSACNKQTGHCDRGCNPGYTNDNCSKECPSGYFGMNCNEKCSGNCINKETCNHVNGVCPSECQDGFVGIHCNKSCMEGYFGTNCSQACSPNCRQDTCRNTDGWCTCSPGWTGDNCTTACNEGYFGIYCFQKCSPNCKPGTCRHTDGVCSCVAGWMGDKCTKACVQSYGEYCRNPCSLQCYNDTCDKINGRCLIGCKDGFYSELCDKENSLRNQPMSTVIILVIGLSVSIFINLILITCGILLCRVIDINRVTFTGTCSLLKCWKKSVYQDIVVKSDETSTYQELDISENAYQNTTVL